jgi:predicted AlkP superfamily pyrophosphatase or phosphodiesterase
MTVVKKFRLLGIALLSFSLAIPLSAAPTAYAHVVLISIDGMHQSDLANYIKAHPASTLAVLSMSGITYTNAMCALPSDSFPGLLALVTGGSPASTGVWYDHTYNRYLLAPGATKDKPGDAGVDLAYDESIDKGYNDGKFGDSSIDPLKFIGTAAIDPTVLPVDPITFQPVYPHNYIKVNTIFEVIKASGKRTYWSDKHPSYDIVNGPSGNGVDELFTPEINSPVPGNKDGKDFTAAVADTIIYDDIKVKALVNEIKGFDHTGANKVAVPAIMGMNFQAVSVGQKLTSGGYSDASGTPVGDLVKGLDGVDAGLGKIVAALKAQNLYNSTLIIIAAKHGQSAIDPAARAFADDSTIVDFLAAKGIVAFTASNDTTMYLWLKDPSQAAAAAAAILAEKPLSPVWDKATKKNLAGNNKTAATWGVFQSVQFGTALPFKDPTATGRFPDLILTPVPGTVYGKPWKKNMEHGGFGEDDTHVALLIAGSGIKPKQINDPVRNQQVAPTILASLGIDPAKLSAVRQEGTAVLPGLGY